MVTHQHQVPITTEHGRPPPHLSPCPIEPSLLFDSDNDFLLDELSIGISTLDSFSFSYDDTSDCDDTILGFPEDEEEPVLVASEAASVDSNGCQKSLDIVDLENDEKEMIFSVVTNKAISLNSLDSSKSVNASPREIDEMEKAELILLLKEHVARKGRRRLQQSFDRWRKVLRWKQLENVTKDEILSQEYYRSKAEYQLDQKNSIASVHFKIGILSDSFHKWRLYTIDQHVKKRRQEVARVHYGDHITSLFFQKWREALKQKNLLQLQLDSYVKAKTFTAWKILTAASREENRKMGEMAAEHYIKRLQRTSYMTWKHEVWSMKADRQYEARCTQRVFKVWTLQLMKRKLQRRLARSYRIKAVQHRFFLVWKSRSEEVMKARENFSSQLGLFVLRYFWQRFKSGVAIERTMRLNGETVQRTCQLNCLRHHFVLWKEQLKIQSFKQDIQKKNCQLVLKRHFDLWKKRRKMLLLERKMDLWKNIQGKLILVKYLSRWEHHWDRQKEKNEEHELCLKMFEHNKVLRCFETWKKRLNQELIVKSFIETKQYDVASKCLKGWLVVKARSDGIKIAQKKSLKRYFLHWRKRAEEEVEKRLQKSERDQALMLRCVTKWKEYASLSRQRRDTNVACYARHWLDVTQQKIMTRKIQQADMENCLLVTKMHFAKWQHQFAKCSRKRNQLENMADNHRKCVLNLKVLNAWLRQQNVTVLVRTYRQEKAKALLSTTFKQWLDVVEDEMQSQINSFKEKLIVSHNSLQSTSTLVPDRTSPGLTNPIRASSVLSKSSFQSSALNNSNELLLELYKDSLESSLVQEEVGAPVPSDKSPSYDGQKTEQSDFLSTSLPPLSTYDTTDDFSYHHEHVDYNTDNDIDQDQIWEEPVTRSQLQLNFSPFSNATSEENHFLQSQLFSYQPCNVLPENTRSATWLYAWKNRYLHSKRIAVHKRMIQTDIVIPDLRCSLLPMSRTSPRSQSVPLSMSGTLSCSQNIRLSLSGLQEASTSGAPLDERKVWLLVSILNYWKHLDVSVVFYSWLRYTQKKKYLRLMLDHLRQKKTRHRIHTVFFQWNRKLYVERAVLYHQEKTLKCRFFAVWLKYRSTRQLRYSQLEQADRMLHMSLLKRCFQEWQKKCHVERLLRGVNNSWSSEMEELLNVAISQRKDKTITTWFNAWKSALERAKSSRQHANNLVLQKCLLAWRCRVAQKSLNRRKLKEFQRDHLQKRVFLTWKSTAYGKIQVRQAGIAKEQETKELVLSQWLQWTRVQVEHKSKVAEIQSVYSQNLLRDALQEWSLHHKQSVVAKAHMNRKTLALVFHAWLEVTLISSEKKMKSQHLQKRSSSRLLLQAFCSWRRRYEAQRKVEESAKQKAAVMLSASFKAWRKVTLCSRADQLYNQTRCREIFRLWKASYVSENKKHFLAKISCRKWKKLVRKGHRKEVVLLDYLCEKNLSLVQHYFEEWRNNRKQVAVERREQRKQQLVRNIALHWKLKTKENIIANNSGKRLSEKYFMLWSERYHMQRKAIANHEWNTKRRFLGSWLDAAQRIKEAEMKVERYRKFKDAQLLLASLQRWRTNLMNIEAENLAESQLNIATKHHQQQIQRAMLQRWITFVTVSKVRRMRENRLARKYLLKWHQSVFTGAAIVGLFRRNMCEKYWRKWRSVYIRRHVLNLMDRRDDRRLMSIVFAAWFRRVQLKRCLPNKIVTLRTRVWFLKWKEKWEETKIADDAEDDSL